MGIHLCLGVSVSMCIYVGLCVCLWMCMDMYEYVYLCLCVCVRMPRCMGVYECNMSGCACKCVSMNVVWVCVGACEGGQGEL